ncbi:hypothetical protein ATC03_07985 [Agromyces aureus]|uniref:Uncharacterized protein n=1 Tax=Agromyces aureus TaxID=453304 RepID=A0A191WEQ0_9MICO|nr:hypothetical protein ATC03_07985 [Agromyces aureus]
MLVTAIHAAAPLVACVMPIMVLLPVGAVLGRSAVDQSAGCRRHHANRPATATRGIREPTADGRPRHPPTNEPPRLSRRTRAP